MSHRVIGRLFAIFSLLTASGFALDREAFTFTNYDLQVRIEPAIPLLTASGKLTLRNDSASPQRVVVLQISSTLDWKSILLANKPVQYLTQPYTSDVDHTGLLSEAVVTLPREVPLKGTIELDITYAGVVPQDATRLERVGTPKDIAAANDWDRISESFTALRGVGYVVWYPVAMEAASLSEGDQISDAVGRWKQRHLGSALSLRLSLAASSASGPPVLVSNGTCAAAVPEPSRNSVRSTNCNWKSLGLEPPVLVAANYTLLERPPARVYHFSGSEAAASDYASVAAAAAPLVTEWMGELRRPVTIVELPAETTPFETGALYLTPLRVVDTKTLEVFLTHQLAHAAMVSPRAWISEGVANFLQAAQSERQAGRMSAILFMQKQLRPLIEVEKNNLAAAEKAAAGQAQQTTSNAATSLINTTDPFLASSKGMYVWWMLRDMLGDRPLQNAFRRYRPEEDREANYAQRLLAAEAQVSAPQEAANLEQFFDDWVYRDRGLPDFHIASVYARQMLNGGFLLTVTVENLGGAAADVAVIGRAKDESDSRRLWVPARLKATIRIPMRSQPTEAQVNDGSVPESNMANNVVPVQSNSQQ